MAPNSGVLDFFIETKQGTTPTLRFKTSLRTSTTSTFSTLKLGFPFWIESGASGELIS